MPQFSEAINLISKKVNVDYGVEGNYAIQKSLRKLESILKRVVKYMSKHEILKC